MIFLSADVHMARHQTHVDGVKDFSAGPVAARPRCENRPGRQLQMASISGFITCDALNYGLVTVRSEADPPELEMRILDATNTVLYQTHIVATPKHA